MTLTRSILDDDSVPRPAPGLTTNRARSPLDVRVQRRRTQTYFGHVSRESVSEEPQHLLLGAKPRFLLFSTRLGAGLLA
jgi:hypothetical protein